MVDTTAFVSTAEKSPYSTLDVWTRHVEVRALIKHFCILNSALKNEKYQNLLSCCTELM